MQEIAFIIGIRCECSAESTTTPQTRVSAPDTASLEGSFRWQRSGPFQCEALPKQRPCQNDAAPLPTALAIEELEACFIVRYGNGQALAYVYFEDESGRRSAAKLLTRDEARKIAVKKIWLKASRFTARLRKPRSRLNCENSRTAVSGPNRLIFHRIYCAPPRTNLLSPR